MPDRKLIPGKFVWFEHVSKDAKKAQAFHDKVFGWRVEPFPIGDTPYEMIYLGDKMLGGYAAPANDRQPAHWISYVSVEDVDGAAKAAAANGGKVVAAPSEMPSVGRMARIADPQGAELYVFTSAMGNDPDVAQTPIGGWLWNELHTTDPTGALAFYGKVVGFTHRTMDMGADGKYHIIGRNGVERGGVTSRLEPGTPSHWLPYVRVEDPDATIANARKAGAKVLFGPEDIPNIGRFGVLQDPLGAVLAVMNPKPM